ncbi:MAG: hypothetical protein ACXVA8_01865, partial [Bdellovibrionota bacterium]
MPALDLSITRSRMTMSAASGVGVAGACGRIPAGGVKPPGLVDGPGGGDAGGGGGEFCAEEGESLAKVPSG